MSKFIQVKMHGVGATRINISQIQYYEETQLRKESRSNEMVSGSKIVLIGGTSYNTISTLSEIDAAIEKALLK